ncbi:pyridoxamine 5'-phosphate oxidase family protein [Pseudaminobacter soli (ex Li et al. 2025)]|uniref:Pyridoxamine 5'-phosphate oxidase n=1 Tax=Pseudaminobacter soli (ex Li et al. 2025) TaxID=1295366 RepID=A0A2P7S3S9_9HYPH|nr:pyridoxamine 5'-phosphate oxidase family protein [Mesorhizobium soli]PSJ57125.1 pyridoxamine 5'-phosphate oxidase [Mesorhizobium soli]
MSIQELRVVTETDEICRIGGDPMPGAVEKVFDRLDRYGRQFIALSPFLCMGSTDAQGSADVSPRGDAPGFVAVLDDRTLLIPERPGNRRFDTMKNLMRNPAVGIIFFVPGINETLRLNGHAKVVDDAALLAGLAFGGHVPKLGITVTIHEVFFHCARALLRSKLWESSARIDRADFPTMGEIVKAQLQLREDEKAIETNIQASYSTELYSNS